MNRENLDATNGSPAEKVWINFVQEKFNNFNLYFPDLRFPRDPVLSLFDPNNILIPWRGANSLWMQFAKLHSKFSIAYHCYSASRKNNPDNFPNFYQGQVVLEYLFKVIADDSILRGQILRLIQGGGISSDAMQENIFKINKVEDNSITDSSESSRKRKVKASKDKTFILLADAIKNVGEPLGQNLSYLPNTCSNLEKENLDLEDSLDIYDSVGNEDSPRAARRRKLLGKKIKVKDSEISIRQICKLIKTCYN